MPFEVQLNRPRARFEIHYRGDVGLGEREAVLGRVAAVAAANGFQQMLVDLREARCVSEDFARCNRFAALLARHACRQAWRIAYVVRAPAPIGSGSAVAVDPALDPALEALLAARGVLLARFVAPTAALAWLQAGTAAGPRGRAKATSLAPQTLRPALLAGCCA